MQSHRKPAIFLIAGTLILLCILIVLGMNYPLVGRGDTIPGIPNLLLLQAALLALLFSGASILLTKSPEESWSKTIGPMFGYLAIGTILLAGSLMFINDALDRSAPQLRQTYLLGKTIHQFRGTDYFLIVQDWQDTTQTIRLRVDPEIYRKFEPAMQAPISVSTANGFLRYERIVGVH